MTEVSLSASTTLPALSPEISFVAMTDGMGVATFLLVERASGMMVEFEPPDEYRPRFGSVEWRGSLLEVQRDPIVPPGRQGCVGRPLVSSPETSIAAELPGGYALAVDGDALFILDACDSRLVINVVLGVESVRVPIDGPPASLISGWIDADGLMWVAIGGSGEGEVPVWRLFAWDGAVVREVTAPCAALAQTFPGTPAAAGAGSIVWPMVCVQGETSYVCVASMQREPASSIIDEFACAETTLSAPFLWSSCGELVAVWGLTADMAGGVLEVRSLLDASLIAAAPVYAAEVALAQAGGCSP